MHTRQAVSDYGRTKLREFYAYAFFLALFTTVTYLNRDFYHGNMKYNTIRNAIISLRFDTPQRSKNFLEIDKTEDFWSYLEAGMPQFLLKDRYDADTLMPSEDPDAENGLLYVMRYNQLIQPIRCRQVRVAVQTGAECEANINIIDAFNKCSPVYKDKYLDKSVFWGLDKGTPLPYTSGEALRTAPFGRGCTTTYDGGGYVIDIPLLSSRESVMATFDSLKKARWVDKQTRAVMIDIVTYNPETMFYLSVRLTFEFLPYGDVRPSYSFRIFKGDIIPSQLDQVLLKWLDIAAFVLIFLHVFFDLYKIFNVGARIFYRNVYNWMNLVIYAISIYVFVKKFDYLGLASVRALSEVGDKLPWTEVHDFEIVGWYYNEIEVLTGFIALFCWLKLLDYVKFLSKGMAALVETIARCTYECSIWFFMLFVIVMAYSQAFFLAFGPEIDGFDDMSTSLGTMMVWIFDVVDYSQVLSTDQILASVLFISFQVVYSMLLINMFIVILLRSYIDVKHQDFNDPIAAELRKKVQREINRWKEKVFSMLSLLAVSASREEEEDDHENEVERLREEARANDFANQEEDEEEIEVNEVTLLRMINRLSELTTDMALVKKKVDGVVKKALFLKAMEEGGEDDSEVVLGGVNKSSKPKSEATWLQSKTGDLNGEGQQREQGQGHESNHDSLKMGVGVSPAKSRSSTAAGEEGGSRSHNLAANEDEEAGEAKGNKAAGKGVSFAIAGSAFGKFPSRPTSGRHVCFDQVRARHIQWLPEGWELGRGGGVSEGPTARLEGLGKGGWTERMS